MHLPSTRTLQAFIAAARLGSLAAASDRVAMSVPALSRRLAGLEQELGVRLLQRVPRGVVLTSAGSAYLTHAVAVLDRLQTAAAELRHNGSIVRVTTIPAFATRWLVPRLATFTGQHPSIEVDLRTSVVFERLDGGEYDFAIRLALDSEMDMAPFLPIHLMPVWTGACPGIIEQPVDILHHTLLGPSHRPEFWREWLESMGLSDAVRPPREIDALLLYEQTLSGTGVAIGIEPLVSGLLHEGRFHALTTHRSRSTRSFFLIEPSSKQTRAARLFKQWLEAEARSD